MTKGQKGTASQSYNPFKWLTRAIFFALFVVTCQWLDTIKVRPVLLMSSLILILTSLLLDLIYNNRIGGTSLTHKRSMKLPRVQ